MFPSLNREKVGPHRRSGTVTVSGEMLGPGYCERNWDVVGVGWPSWVVLYRNLGVRDSCKDAKGTPRRLALPFGPERCSVLDRE